MAERSPTDAMFDAAITKRANEYARRVTDDVVGRLDCIETPTQLSEARKLIDEAIARAFVVGVAAGVEVERGPTRARRRR